MYIKNIITDKLSSKIVSKQVEDKTFTLQFLPESLYHIENTKIIIYKDLKLKTSYLIDIIHSLILKYYFKKENRFAINATILKDRYGYLYNYYISYLVENNIIELITQYQTGITSRVYSLDDKIFNNKIKRYKNYDKILLKKYKIKFIELLKSNNITKPLIDIDIQEKLVLDLFSVNIEFERAIFFLDSLKYQDYDIYNRNIYSVECINNKHIFYHFDAYGRMHTNYTILKSFIRKNCLMIDNEPTCELDINNSQPLFLSKLIQESNTKWVKQDEFELFKELTLNGCYYQYVMDKSNIKDKKKIKELTYKVLFGRNNMNSNADKIFKKLFPTIHNFIILYKKEYNDYKILAYDLQKAESNLIFNKIIKQVINIYPYIKIITIHDSIIINQKYKEIVNNIFQSEISKEFALV